MDLLEQARKTIDETDRQMAELFVQRMKAAESVAAFKKEHGLPVEDKVREEQLFSSRAGQVNPLYRPYYLSFLKETVRQSKLYQKLLLEKMTVAYSGVPGAFAHLAASLIFESAETVSCPDFAGAYRKAETGECNCAVLPIENSYVGDVSGVMDLAYKGTLSISGIYDLPLTQSLLALPGVKLSDIREVRSHPQAISQCMPFLSEHDWQLVPTVNTALAAQSLQEQQQRDVAVIASGKAAEIYGLSVLRSGINESKDNTTRFAVFSPCPCEVHPRDRHFVLLFSTKNEPGALEKAITIISRNHFNLKCLKSHPTGQENWSYFFYTEGDGNIGGENGRLMLTDLKTVCNTVRLLGSFYEEKLLSNV